MKKIKITDAYENREQIIAACKEKHACKTEFNKLLNSETQIEFENVLLANFSWCVEMNIFEEWLPEELPNCIELNCANCYNLQELPLLPNCEKLNCSHCYNLEELPPLPQCIQLVCPSCTKLMELPPLPQCKELYCPNCDNLGSLPPLSNCQKVYCYNCPQLKQYPKMPIGCQLKDIEN